MIRFYLGLCLSLIVLITACKQKQENEKKPIRINQIQALGSHNSYKRKIEPALFQFLFQESPELAQSLEYGHLSLTEQLKTYRLRNLEIDIVHDPEGGRFAKPMGLSLLEQHGLEPQAYDTDKKLEMKGFKTMHVPDIDFRSSCLRLVDCLQEIKDWSDNNRDHLPICITFNAKSDTPERSGFVELLPFTKEVFDALEEEILSVFPKERIVKPDDVRGDFKTLEAAVKAHNWPTLDASRGKIILVLDEGGEKMKAYLDGHPSLKGRLMFVPASPGTPEAGFIIRNYPVRDQDTIRALVKAGYMVRTRADEGTIEARINDFARFEAALGSGAHYISTDYYVADTTLKSNYKVEMPNGVVARCNPVTGNECNTTTLE